MKIALEFNNKEIRKDIITELEERGFNISENTFGTIWVYRIDNIDFEDNIISLNQKSSIKYCSIKIDDLRYFEIKEDK